MSYTASQPPSSAGPRQAGPSSAPSPSSAPAPAPSFPSPTTATATTTTLAPSATSDGQAGPSSPLQSTLPSAETQRHVAEARAAVVASMGNMLDRELQTRASMLHENAAALKRQETDVERATAGLRREREKLAREADIAARKVKELGNVQNWAEVLERGFLVLEETVRLANGGSEGGDRSCSCSCSDCGGSDTGSEAGSDVNGKMDVDLVDGHLDPDDDDKGKQRDVDLDLVMDSDGGPGTWSDASRSLTEPESSTGTSRAKGSETASLSTTS